MERSDKEKASFEMKDPPAQSTTRARTKSYAGLVYGAVLLGAAGGGTGLMFFPEFTVDQKLSAILKVLSGAAIGVLFGGVIGASIGSLCRR